MLHQPKPKFMDLLVLGPKMSITAKVSIFHRVSGLLLFIAIPFILHLFHKTLTEPSFYNAFYSISTCYAAKIFYLVIMWAFIHHMLAGIRFLFLDVHIGIDKDKAKLTAKIVLVLSSMITIGLGVLIW